MIVMMRMSIAVGMTLVRMIMMYKVGVRVMSMTRVVRMLVSKVVTRLASSVLQRYSQSPSK
jgi:hypothetical protein